MLSTIWGLLFNPVATAQNAVSSVYQAGSDLVCSSAVTKAITEERARQDRCDWWAKYGVYVGAGTVLGVLVVSDALKRKG
jgi:hypothetical protein